MRVFLSSTYLDLQPERQAVIEVLQRTTFGPWGMELFTSQPSKPLETALRELESCDAVLLIIGFKAGSLIPEQLDLTYTSAEFEHAKALGRPVFTFIKSHDGLWRNEETEESRRELLDAFREKVEAFVTPGYFSTTDSLRTEILLALQKWDSGGRPGARKTFATHQEVFAPYAEARPTPRLFNYEQVLYGREKEIKALNEFLDSSTSVVALLVGRGGVGKSKLLRDWTSRIEGWQVLFVRDGGIWHAETPREILVGKILIVADDAHRFNSLDQLLALIRDVRQHQDVKLVLGARPSGSSRVESAVARRFDTTEVYKFEPLEMLLLRDVRALAEEVLGPEHQQYAPVLAQLSADTPLVTVVGGRLIARGDIPPALLTNEEAFRRAVFDRFVEEYESVLPPGVIPWRPLLNLVAAVGPLRARSGEFLHPAENFLRRRSDEILGAIDTLERHGLLLRGGNLVRIVPDVLSDYILEGACFNATAESTQFAESVFGSFRAGYLANLLRNLAELDWRITHGHPSAALLDQIWGILMQEFEAGDAVQRVELLKALANAAIYQPARFMQLVRTAMETQAKPVSHYGRWTTTQEAVLQALPSLLEAVAHHREYTREAIRRLWILAKSDNRRPNQYPEYPVRVVEDLASYGRYKRVSFNEHIADLAMELMSEPDAFDRQFTPLDIADILLKKEGTHTESDGLSIAIGGFLLNYPNIKHVRAKALAMVQAALNSPSPRAAARAVTSLSHVLSGFFPIVGRKSAPEEHAWQDVERIQALDMIEGRIRGKPLSIPLARELMSMLRRLTGNGRQGVVGERLRAVLAAIPESDELTVFDAFCTGPWERHLEHGSLEEASARRAERLQHAVELFRDKYPRPHQQVAALESLVIEAEAFGMNVSSSAPGFVEQLCASQEFLQPFTEYLLGNPHPTLAYFMQTVLPILRRINVREYRRVGMAAASHANVNVALGTSAAVSYRSNLSEPIAEDVEILKHLVAHSDRDVRRLAFAGIGTLGKTSSLADTAVALLLQADIGDDSRLADEMCAVFGHGNFDPNVLSEVQVHAVLDKLVPTPELDQHTQYHIAQFLNWVGRAHPALLCEYILKRLEYYAAARRTSPEEAEYHPVPYREFGDSLHGLRQTNHYEGFLVQIRNRLAGDPLEDYWLANLFWAVGALDVTTLSVLDDWLHSGDAGKLKAVIDLLSEAPSRIAITKPWFAVHLVQACAELDSSLADRAMGSLVANAHTGTMTSAVGQPPPRLVELRHRGVELEKSFQHIPLGRRLFSELHQSAVYAIQQHLTQDAELRFRYQ